MPHLSRLVFFISLLVIHLASPHLCESIKSDDEELVFTNLLDGVAILIPGKPLEMECILDGNLDAKVVWYRRLRNSSEEYKLEMDKRTSIGRTNFFRFDTTPDDAGDYICKASSSKNDKHGSALIKVRLEPQIADLGIETNFLGDSCSVEEGQRVELFCGPTNNELEVKSFWLRSLLEDANGDRVEEIYQVNGQFMPPERYKHIYSRDLGNMTSKLLIESARLSDRQYYTCLLKNPFSRPKSRRIYLRVRPRSLLIWPIVGLVGEVLILALIFYFDALKCRPARLALSARPKISALCTPVECLARPTIACDIKATKKQLVMV